MDLQIKDTLATGGGCGCGDCGCGSADTMVAEPVAVATCNCGPDCTCGCQDGQPCTCGDTTSSATCNCGPDCTCGCQDGQPCTCGDTTATTTTDAKAAPAVGVDGEGTSTYHVTGMTCGHCVKAVTEEVSAIPGVSHVDVDLETGRLRVTSDGPVDFDRIVEAVAEAGDYTVE